MNEKKPLNENIHYLNGQIDVLHALILALAGETMKKEQFRQSALQRLETLERTMLNQAVPDERLAAIGHARDWLRLVTS